MRQIRYVHLDEIEPEKFLPILNKLSIRKHLVAHDEFDSVSVKYWIKDKLNEDRIEGCKVRAIELDENLVGWCGIQSSELGFEIAMVLDDSCWGLGKQVFKSLMTWSRNYGHEMVYIHLLHTRPEYDFLRRKSHRVFSTKMLGNRFTTYELSVRNFA
ncbi:N-acetyltransferase [Vibrio cholerae]|nr:N-acetyltransferase [Vibrio cholerae]EGR2083698.1 N-acetyltransferase [Vibrio cholerae]